MSHAPSTAAAPSHVFQGKKLMPLKAFLARTDLIRCLLLSITATASGVFLGHSCLPLIQSTVMDDLPGHHLASLGESSLLFWMRLCLSRAPILLLLMLAGLTRLSGAITSAALAFRGVADGVTLLWLISIQNGTLHTVLPDGITPTRLLTAYAMWMLLDWIARHLMSVQARRIARDRIWSDTRPLLCPSLWQYLAATLTTLCLLLTSCGLYTLILLSPVP